MHVAEKRVLNVTYVSPWAVLQTLYLLIEKWVYIHGFAHGTMFKQALFVT